MKKIYILVLLSVIGHTAFGAELSGFIQQFKATGFVNDYAKLIDSTERKQLEGKIEAINDTTSIQFAILTLQSLDEHAAKDVAEGIANYWGVGQKELNNGILILASVRERAIYIALGEGTDDYITNEYIKTLIKQVIKPSFKVGDYAQGINQAVEKIYMQLRGTDIDKQVVQKKQTTFWIVGIVCFLIVLIGLFWFLRKR